MGRRFCGLTPRRAALVRTLKEPKPTKRTSSPLWVGLRKLLPGAKEGVFRTLSEQIKNSVFFPGNGTSPHLSYESMISLCSMAYFNILCQKAEFRHSLFLERRGRSESTICFGETAKQY
jgi:hypothetical protein